MDLVFNVNIFEWGWTREAGFWGIRRAWVCCWSDHLNRVDRRGLDTAVHLETCK